jgi:hypothetical protein
VSCDLGVCANRTRQRHVEILSVRKEVSATDQPVLATLSHYNFPPVRQF